VGVAGVKAVSIVGYKLTAENRGHFIMANAALPQECAGIVCLHERRQTVSCKDGSRGGAAKALARLRMDEVLQREP
jgi:hypothetical protein